MDAILADLKKASGNTYAFDLVSNNPYKVESYIDTGCYFLNAIMGNGDILAGCPMGKRITLAGAPSTAKSFFSAHLIKKFLQDDESHYAILFESEGASINEMADKLKIAKERLIIFPTFTVEEFKIQSMKVLVQIQDMQEKAKKAKKPIPRFLFVLDSIGMLSTEKSMADAEEGKMKQDMTKQRQLKSVFCNITLLLSLTRTTLINIAHTYMSQDLFSRTIVSGGMGLQYASDVILILSKSKQKKGTETIGAIINCKVNKSRFIPEEKGAKILLLFSKGLSKWSYFIDFGLEAKILTKQGDSIVFPDGTKKSRGDIEKDMDAYFDKPELIEQFRQKIKDYYAFGEETDVDVTMSEEDPDDMDNNGSSDEE